MSRAQSQRRRSSLERRDLTSCNQRGIRWWLLSSVSIFQKGCFKVKKKLTSLSQAEVEAGGSGEAASKLDWDLPDLGSGACVCLED